MTRHNLNEHLPWLLGAKPSVPSETSPLPTVSISISNTPVESTTAPPVESRAQRPSQASQVQGTPRASPQRRNGEEMARLRTAPGSATKRTMVSMGPRIPHNLAMEDEELNQSSLPRSNSQPEASRRNIFDSGHTAFDPADDVEIMDLTEGMGKTIGSDTHNDGRAASSRKRKSSEIEPISSRARSPQQKRAAQPTGVLLRGSQQSSTAIDDIIAQPLEPPPPYSTFAPETAVPARRSIMNVGHSRSDDGLIMPDSEGDDDEIVDFAGSRIKSGRQSCTPPSKKRAVSRQDPDDWVKGSPTIGQSHKAKVAIFGPTVAEKSQRVGPRTPQTETIAPKSPLTRENSENVDSTLLKALFELPPAKVRAVLDELDARRDTLCDSIASCFDEDRGEIEAHALQRELDEIDIRFDNVQKLMTKRDDYYRLSNEKEQLYAALKYAIKARQPTDDARAANTAGKNKLVSFELECGKLLQSCREDVSDLVHVDHDDQGLRDLKTSGVQSTQTEPPALPMHDTIFPSSSRILQTQMVKPSGSELPHGRSADEKFLPTSRKRAAPGLQTDRPPDAHDLARNDDFFDEANDGELVAPGHGLFSNRMGTPPGPFDDDEEEDFGMDDDNDMLDFAASIENQDRIHDKNHVVERQVFAETSGNSRIRIGNTSSKKTKRASAKPEDDDIEQQLFRFPWSQDVKVALRDRFKLRGFRPSQLQSINATLAGKDTFVLMPTGGGKSLCYQLPSLISSGKTKGVTVVISPLLSLMEDQVQHLRKLHIQAFLINSETSQEERNALKQAFREENVEEYIQLLYVTPEMLSKSQSMINSFDQLYRRQKLARLVIDEAHCVSQWGHDFRPDYKLLGDFRRKFPHVPVMALTATATENVKVDTIHNLGIDGCEVFTRSFNRPNLHYEIREKAKGKEDVNEIAKLIKEKYSRQTGIVYCLSRKNCEDMAETLVKKHNIKAHFYHAGLESGKKSEVQKRWQAGEYHVIVATIAFGMGIDKADVRFVVHHSLPKSLEGYYQETGRAGRDGKKSGCYLFYRIQDASKLRRMIDNSDGSWEQKSRLHGMLRKMIQFCENKSDCRRVQVLGYFNETFNRDDCEAQCDNCNSTSIFETVDFTSYARQAVNLVRQIGGDKVTMLYCIDIFRGAKNKKMTQKEHDKLGEFGKAKDLDRGDLERLFHSLVTEGALREDNVINKSGFANQYIVLGANSDAYQYGRKQLQMQVRTTPRAKSKPAPKKSKDEKTKGPAQTRKHVSGPRAELPMSTNVSSPIQAASNRKSTRNTGRGDTHASDYHRDSFVVSDLEDEEYVLTDDEDCSEGFEPVRVAGQQHKDKTRALGPPITSDSMMDDLNEIHQIVVEDFVAEAKKKAGEIMLNKNLRQPPFTDTILRYMAIRFTETEEQMLRIPGIDPERVRLYGKQFCKMVKNCHNSYNDMMDQNEVAVDPDAQNVINLVSEDEGEDEYGSLGESDFEEDDQGEPSAYFQTSKRIEAFNARFAASQSAAMRPTASPQKKKPAGKARRRNYTATGSKGTAARSSSHGGSRIGSYSYGGPSGITKKAPKRRSGGGSARGIGWKAASEHGKKGSGGGGVGILPMPV